MPGFQTMGTENTSAEMFFDQLVRIAANGKRKDQIIEPDCRRDLKNGIPPSTRRHGRRRQRRWCDGNRAQRALKTVSQNMMAFGALVGNDRLDRRLQCFPLTGYAGADKGYKQVTSSH